MKLGISGQRGSGKDTVARAIVELVPHVPILHFATPLKQYTAEIFGLSLEALNDPVRKETPLYDEIEMDDFIGAMSRATSLPIQPRYKVARTPRELLQYFGTDYVRSIADSYWIDATMVRAEQLEHCIIADVRFPNEAAAIRKAGGIIALVIRDGKVKEPEHPSEDVSDLGADFLVQSTTGDFGAIKASAKFYARGFGYKG